MKRFFFMLLTVILPAMSFAGDWVKIGTQDGETYYIYTDIQDEYGSHLVWLKTTYDTPTKQKMMMTKVGVKSYVFEQRCLFAFNSSWTQNTIRKIAIYGKNGNVISSYDAPYDDWKYIMPETIGESWRDTAKQIYSTRNE